MTQEAYTVVGMTRDDYACSVGEEVSAVDGVTDVQVDLATGLINVTTVQLVPVTAVQAAVEEAGYTHSHHRRDVHQPRRDADKHAADRRYDLRVHHAHPPARRSRWTASSPAARPRSTRAC